MKKVVVILFLTCLFTSCGIYQKNKIEYNLPSKMVKLTPEEFALKKEFQSERISPVFKEFYQIDTVLIAFSETRNENLDINVLVKHKDIMFNLINDPSVQPNGFKNYKSDIKDVNDNHFLIQKYDYLEDKSYYEFEVVNNNYTKQKLGIVQFSKGDEKKAELILDDLLKKIQF